MAVRVTLSNGEHDELVLGQFNQGVIVQPSRTYGLATMVDVASSRVVALLCSRRLAGDDFAYGWKQDGGDERLYTKAFIQRVPSKVLMIPLDEAVAWLRNIDRLAEIPGAHYPRLELNPLWDASVAMEKHFKGGV